MVLEEIIVGREPKDMEKYGKKGCLYIGKHIVGKGFDFHLTNPVLMDILRPHVVLVVGKRGSGKCLEGNTLIPLEDGSMIPIKNLESNESKVFALDKRFKISSTERIGFFKRNVEKLLYIRFRSGREIKLTPEHPLLTIRGWREARELTIGSRIATPRKIEVFGNKKMEDYKIKLLAYLIAEGHLKNRFVLFSNTERLIFEDFCDCVNKFDKNLKIEVHSKSDCYRISRKNIFKQKYNPLKKWLEKIGIYNKLSSEKFIPNEIFKLPKEQLSLFLNRLFSCDGSIYKHKTTHGFVWEISYSSSSKRLIQQIQHLLLRFGILSRIRKKKTKLRNKIFDSFEMTIGTENIIKFIREIGFFGKKEEKQEKCLKEILKIRRNPNVDTVPQEIWDFYRPKNWAECGRYFDYTTPKALRSSINYSPSRQKLMQIAMIDNKELIFLLATSDIFWDEIISIEQLEGKFEVYDISIPELHNFVANNIIVHNSYTGGVIGEEIMQLPDEIKENLSCLMIDTMGIFWSMKNPNDQDLMLLNEWELKPKGFQIQNIVPTGLTEFYDNAGISYDGVFSIKPSELSADDWALTFNINIFEPLGILLERVIGKMRGDYSMQDVVDAIEQDERSDEKERLALENRFLSAQNWGIFSSEATPIENFLKPGFIAVLDVSLQEWGVRNLMLGILSREIYQKRMAARREEELAVMGGETVKKIPMVWMLIDEAENFIPATIETAATRDLLRLIRQGRQPGISLVLITQRPNKIHEDAIAQADLVISHRLTSKQDLDSLSAIMQTYMLEDLRKSIEKLPRTKGCALILDDNSERIFNVQVRPRLSWHGGSSPIALKEKVTY